MSKYKNRTYLIVLLILTIVLCIKTNFFRNFLDLNLHNYKDRLVKNYGYCSGESIGYLLYIKEKYKIKDNPKIINYIHTPQVYWSIINTKIINQRSNKLILLNYPGSAIKVNLKKLNNNLFEFKDAQFFLDKFEKIQNLEILNNSKDFKKISWKISIVEIDKNRIKKEIKKFNFKDFLEENLKIELNLPLKNLNFDSDRLYFEITSENKNEFENLKLNILLKNKYILDNFQVIDKFNNCYYIR